MIQGPYGFEFLTLAAEASERDVETGLVANLARLLQTLGTGFYYAGRQFRVALTDETGDEKEYFLDLLFYHHYFRRFVVYELKIDEFRPEYVGKLGFHCNVVDDQLRHDDGHDESTIGILLCVSKSNTIVEHALRGVDTPIAVAKYTYTQLPADLQLALPRPRSFSPSPPRRLRRPKAPASQPTTSPPSSPASPVPSSRLRTDVTNRNVTATFHTRSHRS